MSEKEKSLEQLQEDYLNYKNMILKDAKHKEQMKIQLNYLSRTLIDICMYETREIHKENIAMFDELIEKMKRPIPYYKEIEIEEFDEEKLEEIEIELEDMTEEELAELEEEIPDEELEEALEEELEDLEE